MVAGLAVDAHLPTAFLLLRFFYWRFPANYVELIEQKQKKTWGQVNTIRAWLCGIKIKINKIKKTVLLSKCSYCVFTDPVCALGGLFGHSAIFN
jgi:hypothetical protein